MHRNEERPYRRQIWARVLVEKLEKAQENKARLVKVTDVDVRGKLDLTNRTVIVALDMRHCEFLGEVDLSYCEFEQSVDFSHCTFHADFIAGDENRSHTVFRKDLLCNGAVFKKAALFRGVRCEGKALLRQTRFQSRADEADFGGASFKEALDCEGADFLGSASFSLVRGGFASFERATFHNKLKLIDFTAASFQYLICSDATFRGPVSFNSIECKVSASFPRTKFFGEVQPADETLSLPFTPPPTDFGAASFRYLDCSGVIFNGPVSFNGLECTVSASFEEAKFLEATRCLSWGSVSAEFTAATFKYLNCSKAIFGGPVGFYDLNCAVDATFHGAKFLEKRGAVGGDIEFSYAHFGSNLDLTSSYFERGIRLEEAKISGKLDLSEAQFRDSASLYGTAIGRLVFHHPYIGMSVDLRECTFEWFKGTESQAESLLNSQDRGKFSSDPYVQLEKYYNRIGDTSRATEMYRQGRLALRENAYDKHGSTIWSWKKKLGDELLRGSTGYGVRTGRLFWLALAFIVAGIVIFWSNDALIEVEAPGSSQTSGGTLLASTAPVGEQSSYGLGDRFFDRAAYSVDLFLPVVSFGVDKQWAPNPDYFTGQRYAIVHMFFGWLVVPLLLASLAGIVKRPS